MKDLLTTLWAHLKSTSAQTRLVIGAGVLLTLAVAGVMSVRAANPHLVPAFTGLDNAQFSSVTNALATAGIRFDASSPPGPYSVFVPGGEIYPARKAVATQSALDIGPKGIHPNTGAGGIFDPAIKRLQENQKRDWQDLELQLEAYSFVQGARVRTAGPPPSSLYRTRPPTVAVVLQLRGSVELNPSERRAVASTVRTGAGVPEENITITDQHGDLIFDGAADQTLDEFLRTEREWADMWTARAQEQLDVMFGQGMTSVSVSAELDFKKEESVAESIDPTKIKLTESRTESSTPVDASSGAPVTPVGGPAGVQGNLQGSSPSTTSSTAEATESEESTQYTYGRTTTHTRHGSPTVERLTVSLAVHDSLQDRLAEAKELVKRLVRFDESRGDDFFEAALPLVGVRLDDQGEPVLPEPEPAPTPPNALFTLLVERAVELLAAGAFLFVLFRSLRKGVAKAPPTEAEVEAAAASAAEMPEEELDLDLLARKHVERMLEEDPEKVAALLSRWALGENYYAGAKS